jgi:hypothetical protein
MFKILSQPYPHNATPRKSIVLSIATGLFIASFLNYFNPSAQPIGTTQANHGYCRVLDW